MYGTHETGDVPRLAFIDKATPIAIMNNPITKMMHLFSSFSFLIQIPPNLQYCYAWNLQT